MEPPDTFTYCHSEILLMTDEIKSELAQIHFTVTNLILKIQGNYRALFELSQTLCDLLDNCDLNLQRIRGNIPDSDGDNSLQPGISLTDLSTKEKQLILSRAITSTVAIKVLAGIFDCDFQTSASRLASIQRFPLL
jgi:hypothetical protein